MEYGRQNTILRGDVLSTFILLSIFYYTFIPILLLMFTII